MGPTTTGKDQDQRPDREANDEEGDVGSGYVAGDQLADAEGAGGHGQGVGERGQEVPQDKLPDGHLCRSRNDRGREKHRQPTPFGVRLLAPFDHLLPAFLMLAGPVQQFTSPVVTDGITGQPSDLARDGRRRNHRSQIELALTGADGRGAEGGGTYSGHAGPGGGDGDEQETVLPPGAPEFCRQQHGHAVTLGPPVLGRSDLGHHHLGGFDDQEDRITRNQAEAVDGVRRDGRIHDLAVAEDGADI